MDLLSILSADNYHDRFHPTQGQTRTADLFGSSSAARPRIDSLEQLDLEYQTRYDRACPCYVFETTPEEAEVVGRRGPVAVRSETKKRGQPVDANQQRETPKKKRRPSKANTEAGEAVLVSPLNYFLGRPC